MTAGGITEIGTDNWKHSHFCNFRSVFYLFQKRFSLYQNQLVLQNYSHFLILFLYYHFVVCNYGFVQTSQISIKNIYSYVLILNNKSHSMYEMSFHVSVTKRHRNPTAFEIVNNPQQNQKEFCLLFGISFKNSRAVGL